MFQGGSETTLRPQFLVQQVNDSQIEQFWNAVLGGKNAF